MTGVDAAPAEAHLADEQVSAGLRRCIVSGRVLERERMIRFVLDPDGGVVPDIDERLPGRGLWLSAERAAVQAAGVKVFARAARRPVHVPMDLCDRVERLLLQRCQNLLGLALRARQAVFGFEKVREWLLAGSGGLLIEAGDGAPGECRKLRALAPSLPVLRTLMADEIAVALGRARTVHGVIAATPLALRLIREATRLAGVRAGAETVRPSGAVHPT